MYCEKCVCVCVCCVCTVRSVCAGDEDLSAAVQNVTAGIKATPATASLPDTVSVCVCVISCHCVSCRPMLKWWRTLYATI